MTEIKKDFVAVAFMRERRDAISAAIQGMTLEQELNWFASRKYEDPFLQKLHDRAYAKSGGQPIRAERDYE